MSAVQCTRSMSDVNSNVGLPTEAIPSELRVLMRPELPKESAINQTTNIHTKPYDLRKKCDNLRTDELHTGRHGFTGAMLHTLAGHV